MTNGEIERLLKQEKIYKWQIAEKLGIHETSFVRWFRRQLTQEQITAVISAVEEIRLERLLKAKQ